MRTNKFISFLVALIVHLVPLGFFLFKSSPIHSNGAPQNKVIKGIDLSTFSFNQRNMRQLQKTSVVPRNLQSDSKIEGSTIDSTLGSTTGTSTGSENSSPTGINESQQSFSFYKEPIYPPIARMKGYMGKVKIKVIYNDSGLIQNVVLVESSGVAMLDESVKKAASEWKMTKGKSGWFEKSFEFNLKN